jgi:hypothetical protein
MEYKKREMKVINDYDTFTKEVPDTSLFPSLITFSPPPLPTTLPH